MDIRKAQDLVRQMVEMTEELQNVDVSQTPTDAESDVYNALREAAHGLVTITNYIIEG